MADSRTLQIVIKGVDQASGEIKKASGGMTGAFAAVQKAALIAATAVAGATIAVVKSFANTGEELQKFKAATGVSAEAASVFKMATEEMGSSLELVEGGIKKMQLSLTTFGKSSKAADDALKPLGITMADLKALKPEDQFVKLGNAIGAIEDPTKRTAEAVKIFGKSGTDLLPLFEKGKFDLAGLREEAAKTGQLFSNEMLTSAVNMDNAFDKLNSSMKGAQMQIAAALAPAITELVNAIIPVIQQVSAWIAENPELTVNIIKVTGAVVALIAAMNPIGAVIAIVIAGLVGLDAWLKQNGLSWSQFGLLIKAILLQTQLDFQSSVQHIQLLLAQMSGASRETLDKMVTDFTNNDRRLKDEIDNTYTEIAAIPAQKLAASKQAAIEQINIRKQALATVAGKEKDEQIAIINQMYEGYKAKFGETVTATTEALERARVASNNKLSQMASEAIAWGAHFVDNLRLGVLGKIPALSGAIGAVKTVLSTLHQSYNPLLPAQLWGEHFVQNIGTGIKGSMPYVSDALRSVTVQFNNFRSQINRITDTSQDIANLKRLEGQLKSITAAGNADVTAKESLLSQLYKQFAAEDMATRKAAAEKRLKDAQDATEKESAQAELAQIQLDEHRQGLLDDAQASIDGAKAKAQANIDAKNAEIEAEKLQIQQKQDLNQQLLNQLAAQQQLFENQVTAMYQQADLQDQLSHAKTAKEKKAIEDQLNQAISAARLQTVKDSEAAELAASNNVYSTEAGNINKLMVLYQQLATAKAAALSGGGGGPSLAPSKAKKKAGGGPLSAGDVSIVGEAGPELFVPDVRGTVIPSSKSNVGGSTVIINVTGNTLLDDHAAEEIGDMIIDRLKLQLRLAI